MVQTRPPHRGLQPLLRAWALCNARQPLATTPVAITIEENAPLTGRRWHRSSGDEAAKGGQSASLHGEEIFQKCRRSSISQCSSNEANEPVMASQEGKSEPDHHAGETARLTQGASRDKVFPRSAVPRPSSSTSSEVMSSTPRTPSRASTPGNPDDSMLSPRQPGQRTSPGNASRRDSVMALGSISHLQRHYAKEGL